VTASRAAILVFAFAFLASLIAGVALAHDHARPELNEWMKKLQSRSKVSCCDGRDGTRLEDADWEIRGTAYWVRVSGIWLRVPDNAVVTEANIAGTAIVWLSSGYIKEIRCFMPGTMG
jgi:hypothetical protein